MSIGVLVKFEVKPSHRAAFLETTKRMIDCTLKEKGCIYYYLTQSLENEDEYWMLEEWESVADLDVHSQANHVTEAREKFVTQLSSFPPAVLRIKKLP